MQIEAKRPIDRDPLRRAKQRRFIAADVAGQGEASLRPPLSIEVSPASAEINGGQFLFRQPLSLCTCIYVRRLRSPISLHIPAASRGAPMLIG
ncbi:hypothetical protein VPH35_028861 [Triticum aestivum]